MAQLIDKAAVVAEIERRRKLVSDPILSGDDLMIGERKALFNLLSFINTLEVKAVDLEKEIKNRIDSLSNLYCYMEDLFNGNEEEGVYPIPENVKNELFEFAKHFFELGLKTKKGE